MIPQSVDPRKFERIPYKDYTKGEQSTQPRSPAQQLQRYAASVTIERQTKQSSLFANLNIDRSTKCDSASDESLLNLSTPGTSGPFGNEIPSERSISATEQRPSRSPSLEVFQKSSLHEQYSQHSNASDIPTPQIPVGLANYAASSHNSKDSDEVNRNLPEGITDLDNATPPGKLIFKKAPPVHQNRTHIAHRMLAQGMARSALDKYKSDTFSRWCAPQDKPCIQISSRRTRSQRYLVLLNELYGPGDIHRGSRKPYKVSFLKTSYLTNNLFFGIHYR